jgi:hypothetical protein
VRRQHLCHMRWLCLAGEWRCAQAAKKSGSSSISWIAARGCHLFRGGTASRRDFNELEFGTVDEWE